MLKLSPHYELLAQMLGSCSPPIRDRLGWCWVAERPARPAWSACPIFELGKKPEQIATQPTAIATRDPDSARPIKRLGDRVRGRNRL